MSEVITYGKPDFICIGFEKVATTWLYKFLNQHPEIEMPPLKEFRYFNQGEDIPNTSLATRYFKNHWHNRIERDYLIQFFRQYVLHPRTTENRGWWFRYLFYPRSDSWYSNLFISNKVSGDITPTYTYLSQEKITHIRKTFPDTKIIVLLREPTSRLWSKLKMILGVHSGREMDKIDEWEVNQMINVLLQVEPMLSETIEKWTREFPQLEVIFQEDVISQPTDVMNKVFKLLGCSEHQLKSEDLERKIHIGISGKMPEDIRKRFIRHHLDDVKKLSEMVDSKHPRQWLSSYSKYI